MGGSGELLIGGEGLDSLVYRAVSGPGELNGGNGADVLFGAARSTRVSSILIDTVLSIVEVEQSKDDLNMNVVDGEDTLTFPALAP